MSIAKAKVGDIFSSKFCGDFVVLSYINSANVRIRFLHTGYETVTRNCQVKNGQVKATQVGMLNKTDLMQFIDSHL